MNTFTFDSDIKRYFDKANIIIAHGGAGITFEALNMDKRLISIENPHALGGHQADLLEKMSSEKYLVWCKELCELEECIKNVSCTKEYSKPKCEIGKRIKQFLRIYE